MSQTEAPTAAEPRVPPDPILRKSYAFPILLSMAAVVGAVVLTVADEMYLRRPYKKVQGQYQQTYSAYLERVEAKRREFYDSVLTQVAEFKAKNDAVEAAAKATHAARDAAEAALKTATKQSRNLGEALKVSKSELSALTYKAEHKAHEAGHAKVEDAPEARPILEEIAKINARDITYSWSVWAPTDVVKPVKEDTETGKVADLLVKALALEELKAKLQQDLGEASKPLAEASKAKEEWLADHVGDLKYALENADDATKKAIAESGVVHYLDQGVVSLRPDDLGKMRAQVDEIPHDWNLFKVGPANVPLFRGEIKQIHIKEAANWVDRCETCHLNARAPMPVTVESLRRVLSTELTVSPRGSSGEPLKDTDGDPISKTYRAWDQAKIDSMPLALFASHPNPELLRKHDPERFGCSMCHNGNGVAVTSVELAHGQNHHWLWPLYPKANIQAGCVQCHQSDLFLEHGDRINAGKDDFRRAGCWGCHKYEGFNKELDQITLLEGRKKEIGEATKEKNLRSENLWNVFGAMPDPSGDDESKRYEDTKKKVDRDRKALIEEVAELETEAGQIERRLRGAYVERQRVGPNAKDVKIKIRREFLTDWIKSPRDAHKDASGRPFRPETKMPTFRWANDEEVKDVAAFFWQSSLDPNEFPEYRLPAFAPGDANRGKDLFTQRGCLICHSIGTGADRVGNDYAANLTNLGEKNRPEFVQRWVHHPRERLVAYDPARKPGERDVTGVKPADPGADRYVWSNHTIMPNFRLPDDEVRDITTYLVSQKRSDVKYEEPTWLDDPARMERGKKLVLFQGCAGCHEIRGLEDEKGIGTELTKEGSKPRDQLDFGHLTIPAERGVEPLKNGEGLLEDAATLFQKDEFWYRTRGFVMHKIAKPDIYDESKHLPDRYTRLRMPQFKLSAAEITDLTTFILGSVETKLPATAKYTPDEPGQAIREGWWIVKKYNCQGCHQILPSDTPSLWQTPFYAQKLTENGGRDRWLPPSLVGVGARLQPEFIAKFLRDPSLGGDRAAAASVRSHLEVRMPTFDFSEDEIGKLVRFFEAMSKQPSVYQPPQIKPLTEAEQRAATAIWKASGSCNQCHLAEGAPMTADIKAPNLAFAPERLRPDWMKRWIAYPGGMHPDTAMTIQFGWMEDGKIVQPGPSKSPPPNPKWLYMTTLPELQGVESDHIDLMIRYLLTGKAGK
jgi:hypothetical protein